MSKEKWEEQFNKLGFYELEEIEKDFKLNQEIIKVRNNVKQFIRTIRLKDREELKKKVGMLRQWLNEDRITDTNKMVSTEDLLHWLN